MSSTYTILRRLPTPQEYLSLRTSANLTPPPLSSAAVALPSSVVCFLVYEVDPMLNPTTPRPSQHPVGMARLIGDGALFLQVTDVCVHPTHQRQGLGKRIMETVVAWIDEHAPDAYVSLIGDPLGQGLYRKFGFVDTQPSVGMFRCRRIQENPEFRKLKEERGKVVVRTESEA